MLFTHNLSFSSLQLTSSCAFYDNFFFSGVLEFSLMWRICLYYPVQALLAMDMMGDGLIGLSALTSRGVHVFGPDRQSARRLRSARLEALKL